MPQRCQLDPVFKGRIFGCLEAGQTQTAVSQALNVPQSVIFRLGISSTKEEVFIGCLYTVAHGSQCHTGLIFNYNSMMTAEDVYKTTVFRTCRGLRHSSFKANCIPETRSSQSLCQTSSNVCPTDWSTHTVAFTVESATSTLNLE